jgi:asparagine synthase (glutamine-hydrolysing)
MRGMFAFALWDAGKKWLFAARDRLGKKPFCYTRTGRSFIFGSEIKAITADPEVSVSPNFYAIDQYLTYQYVPSPLTAFDGIHRLPPGHFVTCSVAGDLKIQRYWEPPISQRTKASEEDIRQEILHQLRESVKLRLISDVPLGALLSGGIDSSIVIAMMAQESDQAVKTFSIGFEEENHNELPYARLIAKYYGTDHHEFIVKPDATEVLPILVKHYNEPFADSSALPTYYVSRMAKKHVTVALSGDGGDESFAGYVNYAAILGWNKWDALPFNLRRVIAKGARAALHLFPSSNTAARLRRSFGMLGASNVKERLLQYATILKPEEKRLAYTQLFMELISKPDLPPDPLADFPWNENIDNLDWLMLHDLNFYLPDCLMVKTDIASMTNSLEVRCPFLDHEFVEFALSIPSSMKRDTMSGKIILKKAVKDLLPPEILNRPKKGFSAPIGEWFRGDLLPLLQEALLDGRSAKRGLIRQHLIGRMVDEHSECRRDWSTRLWAFLFLELWFREFID